MIPEPGTPYTHYTRDDGTIHFEHGQVRIVDVDGREICWVADEWEEDVEAVTATLNAVSLALSHGATTVMDRAKVPRPRKVKQRGSE